MSKKDESADNQNISLPPGTIEAIGKWPKRALELIVEQDTSGTFISNEANTASFVAKILSAAAENEKERGPNAHLSNQPTYNITTGVLTINDKTISLEGSERDVLGILVSLRAGTFSDLQATQSPRPDKILHRLCEKYPELQNHIFFPGAKGHGGYSTNIVSAGSATIGP